MGSIPFKARRSPARLAIKDLKENFDETERSPLEQALWRAVQLHPNEPAIASWMGEIYHQLALRNERRGDITTARRFYLEAGNAFRPHELMGRARWLRDYGIFLCHQGEADEGLPLIEKAVSLLESDIGNAKSERQKRITQGYLSRAQILAGIDTGTALENLVSFALHNSTDCSIRDQLVAVNFVVRYASGADRLKLHARQLELNARRRQKRETAVSVARVMIDIQLIVMSRLVRKIFRRE